MKNLSYFKYTYDWRIFLAHARKTDLSQHEQKDHYGEFLAYWKGHTAEDLSLIAKQHHSNI